MRFVVLMAEEDHFARWEHTAEDERRVVFERFAAFSAAVEERGAVVAGAGLAAPDQARTLRASSGGSGAARTVTEGPYAEAVEQLGGLWIVDLPDHATALELAALLPEQWSIEVRPTTEE